MNIYTDKKNNENKSKAVPNSSTTQKSNSKTTFQFIDNRPETVAQAKLQEAIYNSPRVQKSSIYQAIDDSFSSTPAQLQAYAYAQGTDIHLASGQEKHLPHEAWHVVQQKRGMVKPTIQIKGNVNANDDVKLEKEADLMGAKAIQSNKPNMQLANSSHENDIVQRTVETDLSESEHYLSRTKSYESDTLG